MEEKGKTEVPSSSVKPPGSAYKLVTSRASGLSQDSNFQNEGFSFGAPLQSGSTIPGGDPPGGSKLSPRLSISAGAVFIKRVFQK